MKNSMKQIAVLAVLLATALCFTSSSEPGYDENGQDINECMTGKACPERYTCINLPGSYLCEPIPGIVNPFSLKNGAGAIYYLWGSCGGLQYDCEARCTQCYREYYGGPIGRAYALMGKCVCGCKSFEAI